MPTLPPLTPLQKEALRHLLTPSPTANPPSAAALRQAKPWAIAANLINDQGLTAEGKLVTTKDPYLEATVTDWLIHLHLSFCDRSLMTKKRQIFPVFWNGQRVSSRWMAGQTQSPD